MCDQHFTGIADGYGADFLTILYTTIKFSQWFPT